MNKRKRFLNKSILRPKIMNIKNKKIQVIKDFLKLINLNYKDFLKILEV